MSFGIKKFTAVILAIAAVFVSCFGVSAAFGEDVTALLAAKKEPFAETVKRITGYDLSPDWDTPEFSCRAVWFSYLDWQTFLADKNESDFTEAVERILSDCASRKIDTVYLQLRAFGDAFYPSAQSPFSAYLGAAPDYDPLAVWLDAAQRYGIGIHGWLNPFRMGKQKPSLPALAAADGYYWLDPAKDAVVTELLAVVDELCERYALAGIQFDDYFYSGVSPESFGYDAKTARAALTRFIRSVSEQLPIPLSISPQGAFTADGAPKSDVNLHTSLQEWCKCGYLDALLPQVYFGFENETAPFADTVEQWRDLTEGCEVELIIGLAAYKCGKEDLYAGSGKREWIEQPNLIERQMAYLDGKADGYALFRYGMLE